MLVSQVAAQQEQPQPSAAKERTPPTALELAKEKVAKHPEDAEAQYRLAVAYRHELQSREAVPHIVEAIQRNPLVGKYHAERGLLVFLAEGDLTEKSSNDAIADFEKAVALEPQNSDVWVMFGDFQNQLDKPALALPKYERALLLSPTHAAALHGKGMILFQQNKWDDAKVCLQNAYDLDREYEAQAKKKGENFRRDINQETLSDLPASYLSHFQRIDVTLSLARIHERQADHPKRDQYFDQLYTIHREANDSIDSFVRDEFDVDAYHVVAHEFYSFSSSHPSKFVFEIKKDGKATNDFRLIAISSKPSPGSQQANRFYLQRVRLGLLTHTTTYKVFDTLPSYHETKALLLDVLREEAQPLPPEQSSAAN